MARWPHVAAVVIAVWSEVVITPAIYGVSLGMPIGRVWGRSPTRGGPPNGVNCRVEALSKRRASSDH